jgi:hypothetical protein
MHSGHLLFLCQKVRSVSSRLDVVVLCARLAELESEGILLEKKAWSSGSFLHSRASEVLIVDP